MDPFKLGKIGVLMGGRSREREISLRSGRAVYRALRQQGFQAEALDTGDADNLRTLASRQLEFAFIALHGKGGEDGEIQRYLDALGIPYLGSGSRASAKAFDKVQAKNVFSSSHISTPRFEVLSSELWPGGLPMLRFPVFLKPPEEGSSIDVFLVEKEEEFEASLRKLFSNHPVVLAEEKVEGPEITVGILGQQPLPVVEIRPHRVFYDYVAKYQSPETEYIVPARLPEESIRQAQETALAVHQALGLRDFSRVDMILAEEGPVVLEANTLPGFTETSLLPKAAQAAGLDFGALCGELIKIALERVQHEEKNKGADIAKIFIS